MNRSLNANVFEMTRLVKHFNDDNADSFTRCLMEQLHCENKGEYVCQVIKCISCLLSDESVDILRNKAILIAQEQIFEINSQTKDKKGDISITESKQKQSVFKWVQSHYRDRLSKLPSSIIDHMASYLDKKQSTEFGYLNKQLYIESQKQSYLIKRSRENDRFFRITSNVLDRFFWKQTNPFAYSTPYYLRVGTYDRNNDYNDYKAYNDDIVSRINDPETAGKFIAKRALFTSDWFTNTLKRVKKIEFVWLSCLQYISIPVLFGINNNNNNGKDYGYNQNNMIDCMEFCINQRDDIRLRYINSFCNAISGQNVMDKASRKIKTLIISPQCERWCTPLVDRRNECAKKLLFSLGPLSQVIRLNNALFSVDYSDFCKVFGANINVKELAFTGRCNFKIIGLPSNADSKRIKIDNQITTITRDLTSSRGLDEARKFIQLLKDLNIYQLAPQLKCYKIICGYDVECAPDWKKMNKKWDRQTSPLLHKTRTKIFLDYVLSNELHSIKPRLFEKIILKFHDNEWLSIMANLFLYFIDKRRCFTDLFERQTNIKTIEMDVSVGVAIRFISHRFVRIETIESIDAKLDEFFGFSKNKD